MVQLWEALPFSTRVHTVEVAESVKFFFLIFITWKNVYPKIMSNVLITKIIFLKKQLTLLYILPL